MQEYFLHINIFLPQSFFYNKLIKNFIDQLTIILIIWFYNKLVTIYK